MSNLVNILMPRLYPAEVGGPQARDLDGVEVSKVRKKYFSEHNILKVIDRIYVLEIMYVLDRILICS